MPSMTILKASPSVVVVVVVVVEVVVVVVVVEVVAVESALGTSKASAVLCA